MALSQRRLALRCGLYYPPPGELVRADSGWGPSESPAPQLASAPGLQPLANAMPSLRSSLITAAAFFWPSRGRAGDCFVLEGGTGRRLDLLQRAPRSGSVGGLFSTIGIDHARVSRPYPRGLIASEKAEP